MPDVRPRSPAARCSPAPPRPPGDTWEWFPFTMLMTLAALQMVPKEPQEAARIDGAGPVQLFRHVRLPFIRGTLVVAALFRLIDSIKAIPLIYLLTDGGPGGAAQVCSRCSSSPCSYAAIW
jgi:ABC-type sugar transport system permease subunit